MDIVLGEDYSAQEMHTIELNIYIKKGLPLCQTFQSPKIISQA